MRPARCRGIVADAPADASRVMRYLNGWPAALSSGTMRSLLARIETLAKVER
jgi:hypothetical protein